MTRAEDHAWWQGSLAVGDHDVGGVSQDASQGMLGVGLAGKPYHIIISQIWSGNRVLPRLRSVLIYIVNMWVTCVIHYISHTGIVLDVKHKNRDKFNLHVYNNAHND